MSALRSRRRLRNPSLFLPLGIAALGLLSACGVQSPPQPPRLEQPQQIKDLQAAEIGQTLQISFTLPVLATDGERLNKPLEVQIFRAITPPGQSIAQPDTSLAPWVTLLPSDLAQSTREDKMVYSYRISDQDFRAHQAATFSFSVVALTRGFRRRPHRSEPSNVAQTELVDVTRPPEHLSVTPSQTMLRLTWTKPAQTLTGTAPSNLTGYRIYTSPTGKPGSFQLHAEPRTNQFDDSDFQFGQHYYFKVSAVSSLDGSHAESEPSEAVSILPQDVFPPAVPRGLSAVYTAGAIDLLWNANTDVDLAGYNVYRKTGSAPFERANPQLLRTPIFHDASVASGHSYDYAVTAVDLTGNESEKSEVRSVTASPPDGR